MGPRKLQCPACQVKQERPENRNRQSSLTCAKFQRLGAYKLQGFASRTIQVVLLNQHDRLDYKLVGP